MGARVIVAIVLAGLAVLFIGYAQPCVAQGAALIPLSAAVVLRRNPGGAIEGAKNPDVVLVEFFDYDCPYCKRLVPAIKALLHQDAKVAIIYKDWPILGNTSVYAARAALAAEWQGKYLIAHDALLRGARLASAAQVDAVLEREGLDMQQLRKDQVTHASEIDARLARIDTEARALGIRGTPGLLVGRRPTPGDADAVTLQQAVAAVRRNP